MPRHAEPDPSGLPQVVTYEEALDSGLTRGQIQHRVESGRWARLMYGLYRTNSSPTSHRDRFEQLQQDHVDRAMVALRRYPKSVLGLESAAVWHRMPLRSVELTRVELLVPPGHPRGSRAAVRFHRSDVPRGHRTRHDRDGSAGWLRVTSPERTWFDLARHRALGDALMAGDAALRSGRMQLDQASSMLAECADLRGAGKAATALVHLSAKRESPLESDSWAYFVTHRLPLPEIQVPILDDRGRLLGRADYWWEKAGLVGECDGRSKYTDPDVLYAEKRREDAIRAQGHTVIRWGASDLWDGRLAQRIRSALRESHRR